MTRKRTALSRLGVILVVTLVMASFAGVAGAATDHFTDDNGNIHEANINYIADLGITIGCNAEGTLFCPGGDVTRAEMATFLARAFNLPAATTDWTLTDVATQEIDCRPQYCPEGSECAETGECVTPTMDCAAACATGEARIAGTCAAVLPDPYVEDLPRATGLYNSASEVIRKALRLLEERDEMRKMRLAALRKEISAGLDQLERGEVSEYDHRSLSTLAADVKAKGAHTPCRK